MDKMGGGEPVKMTNEAMKDATNPQKPPRRRLLSKLMRSAALAAGEEVIASTMMRVKDDGPGFTSRVPKMAIYGTLIDAAVTHLVLKCLRAIMDQLWHRTGIPRSLRSIISLIIFAPIQKLTRFLTIAYLSGAQTYERLLSTVRKAFLPSLAVLALLAPAAVAFAHIFLPERTWPLFFRSLSLFIRVYDNILLKKVIRKVDKREERHDRRSLRTQFSGSTISQNR